MAEPAFSCFVPGTPRPAGSKRAIPVFNRRTGTYARAAGGRPIVSVVDDSKHSRPWKDRITGIACDEWQGRALLDGPLELSLVFTMPRPQSHYGKRKGESYLKSTAPRYHTSAPDATKLVRAAEDALSGVIWKDDRQVVEQRVRKVYGEVPGVAIVVREIDQCAATEPTPARQRA